MSALDIIEFNKNHNTPSELMLAVKALTPGQRETLALDLVWKLTTTRRRLVAKRAILEANLRPL